MYFKYKFSTTTSAITTTATQHYLPENIAEQSSDVLLIHFLVQRPHLQHLSRCTPEELSAPEKIRIFLQ